MATVTLGPVVGKVADQTAHVLIGRDRDVDVTLWRPDTGHTVRQPRTCGKNRPAVFSLEGSPRPTRRTRRSSTSSSPRPRRSCSRSPGTSPSARFTNSFNVFKAFTPWKDRLITYGFQVTDNEVGALGKGRPIRYKYQVSDDRPCTRSPSWSPGSACRSTARTAVRRISRRSGPLSRCTITPPRSTARRSRRGITRDKLSSEGAPIRTPTNDDGSDPLKAFVKRAYEFYKQRHVARSVGMDPRRHPPELFLSGNESRVVARSNSVGLRSVEIAPRLQGDPRGPGGPHAERTRTENQETNRRKSEPDFGAERFTIESGFRPAAGAPVSNLRCVLDGGGASGLGTLGFLAATAGSRDWASLVLVSNRHVLLAHGATVGDAIFQPGIERCEARLRFPRDRLNPVAAIEDTGFEGNYRFPYPGEPAASYFIDCATARLSQTQAPLGGGGPVLFRCIARAHRFDTFAGRELRVRKLGIDAGLTGRLVEVAATVTDEDGGRRHNTIVIRSLPARDGALRPFAAAGDSGALVVDELDRAIGLVWGVSLSDPSVAYACHIHPVLDRLKVTPWRYELPPETEGQDKER